MNIFRRDIDIEIEKAVNRLAFNIQRRNAGGGKHNGAFVGHPAKMRQQGGFPRTRFAGDEKALLGFFHQVNGVLKLVVDLDFSHSSQER